MKDAVSIKTMMQLKDSPEFQWQPACPTINSGCNHSKPLFICQLLISLINFINIESVIYSIIKLNIRSA